ncbi:ABC transporter permease [Calditerrivibrio nitroreducens]|uniref:Binding-protein-dependent transport systems inner membrane component n=1 Tax=Calditerrivibrio nitroreducens (strain DSM 19672 / NBRC 101217 / Yu37-1) TaxID=768670 RepID=E4TIT2_CALNY|nr:ABC transporter permease subunit [Calditerrivibrio nitroreducens]ADR18037.1 binding-protein-dependent transport systems inner membrane component [Calditerrivibrio nitroreducens DSM 19672]
MKLKIFLVILFLLIWEVASFFTESYILPGPFHVLKVIYQSINYDLLKNTWSSLLRLLFGYTISIITALILAITAQKYDIIKRSVSIISSSALKVPNIAYLTFFMLFVGVGDYTVILTIVVTLIPTITLSFLSVFDQLNRHVIEISDIFRVPFYRRALFFYIPSLVESFSSILSLTFSLGFKLLIMAEFIAGTNGLGYRLVEKKVSFNMDEVMAYILIIVISGILAQKGLEIGFERIKRWIF